MRRITQIILHHSASARDTTTIDMIKEWHKARDFPHIGYHYVITGEGETKKTWPIEEEGFGVFGKNKYTVHVCLTGNFESERPSNNQLYALERLLKKLCKNLRLNMYDIFGHKEVAPSDHMTVCPGSNLMAELNFIRLRIEQNKKDEWPLNIALETMPNWKDRLFEQIVGFLRKLLKRGQSALN